jgi:hypothetical protein
MTTKRTTVLESFVIIGSFDCDHTHITVIELWPIGLMPKELYFLPNISYGMLQLEENNEYLVFFYEH